MALRFRKSIKLAPGVRWNVSGSGSSWTFGPRGYSVGVGKRGTFLNTGIPGTGFASRERLGRPNSATEAGRSTQTTMMTCSVADDGTLNFVGLDGGAIPPETVEIAKKQNRDAILSLIQQKCDEINGQIEALGRLHHDTPNPSTKPRFVTPHFEPEKPASPRPIVPGVMDKLLGRKAQIEATNQQANEAHAAELAEWRAAKAAFDRDNAIRKVMVETLIYEDPEAMATFLEEWLGDIAWPRETAVAVSIEHGGTTVALDVDLPEIEDMPTKLAAVPSRGLKLSLKEMASTRVQRLYAEHVHGVVFRMIGETFAALPIAQTVIVSGYSQRRDPATGKLHEDYLLSARVRRSAWSEIDFEHLPAVDVIVALDRFELRREMLKTGRLKAIDPHRAV